MGESDHAPRPFFSVVVPAFNAETTLTETLDSIIVQTFHDWECVVVNDGSTDRTLELASAFAQKDQRIRVIHQENRGTGGAYNVGVRAASGRWVTICSADDLLLPAHLEMMCQAIDKSGDYDLLSSNGYYLKPDGSLDLVYASETDSAPRSWSIDDQVERYFFSVGAVNKKTLFDSVGGYDERAYGEDYDFWLRAMSQGAQHLYIPTATAVHRLGVDQKSVNYVRVWRSDIRSIRVIIRSGLLSRAQRLSAQRAIKERRRLIFANSKLAHLRSRVKHRRFRIIRRMLDG